MEAERRSTLSSLKGQLANVEGSVKSMKMAVVVGSVLTVACLAAVFGVTILANEVSKETKVSNGALVNRQGDMIQTATLSEGNLYEDMVEGRINVGDIIKAPLYKKGEQTPIPGSYVECAIEFVKRDDVSVVAACDDVAFQAPLTETMVYVIVYEDSKFSDGKLPSPPPVASREVVSSIVSLIVSSIVC